MRGRDMIPPFPPFPHTFKAGPKTLELLCPDTPVPAPLSHRRRLTRPVTLWPICMWGARPLPVRPQALAGSETDRAVTGMPVHHNPKAGRDRQLRLESGCGKLRHDTPHRRRREHGTEVQLHVPPLNTAQHPAVAPALHELLLGHRRRSASPPVGATPMCVGGIYVTPLNHPLPVGEDVAAH